MKKISKKIALLALSSATLFASEPIVPIPKVVEYDLKKALLGKELFEETGLSKDSKVACVNCHSYEHGGAGNEKVSVGAHDSKSSANIPTVFNAYFNFRQFYNGRAKDLKEHLKDSLNSSTKMYKSTKDIETFLRNSKKYLELFEDVYNKKPSVDLMIDAIVEFEKALYTPDSRFDRFLRGEIELTDREMRGYKLFKKFGCITCHTGVNVGGNSFQKAGLIVEIPWSDKNPDLYSLTKKEADKNVYKVPTLRNIALTKPYLHNGMFDSLKEAVITIAYVNLGIRISEEEALDVVEFFKSLTGKKPKILQEYEK